jgi:hypothetical protein
MDAGKRTGRSIITLEAVGTHRSGAVGRVAFNTGQTCSYCHPYSSQNIFHRSLGALLDNKYATVV